MKIYETENGELIKGETPLEVVTDLRDGSKFASHESIKEFMNGFKIRWFEYSGNEIRDNDPENFITDLIETGYMKEK